MTNFSKMTVKQLRMFCKKNNIKKYSRLRKKELIQYIEMYFPNNVDVLNDKPDESVKSVKSDKKKVTFMVPPPKPFEVMNRFELVLECKKLKIKGYSKMKKKELIKNLKKIYNDSLQTHYKKEESLFFYPDIITEIFSYIELNSIDEYRKKLIKNAPRELKKANTVYDKIKVMTNYRKIRRYVEQNNYISQWDVSNKLNINRILVKTEKELSHSVKNEKYIWLKTLKYKVKRSMRNGELMTMIHDAFKDLV